MYLNCCQSISHLWSVLQCIIPVFEELFPEEHKHHEKEILDILFLLATWHAYAKLHLHTEHTLNSFEQLTAPLGERINLFAGKIPDDFVVRELHKETAAKAWHAAANLKQKTTKGKQPATKQTKGRAPVKKSTKGKQGGKKSTRDKQSEKVISMSLLTYKLQALGDYVQTIRQ